MNPTEIFEALEQISSKQFEPNEFPFEFAEATDVAQAAIAKLRNGTTNKSDQPGGVLVSKKFHFAPAMTGMASITLEALRNSKKTATAKPAILIATDGNMVAAEHRSSGDTLHCRFDEIGDNFGFFLPAAGKERYKAAEENPIDVKVTAKLAKLYDALVRKNPDWASDARRHEMNQLMMRLIFCMFAEDVGIFPDNQFSQILFNHAGNKGEEAREVIVAAFTAMNRPKNKRNHLPAWAGELEFVNGGLFAGPIDAPVFDEKAYRYLRDACDEDWRDINPDIFGSMIQSVADPKQRSELGMHYTSVPNIMKVIGPLFLDDLDGEIKKAWERPNGLRKVLTRIEGIRVFDPACGSGNFLVVSYRQLREREMRILERLEELTGESTKEMFSAVQIANFHGIEITDFGAETAKLALFIAEYQANAVFKEVFGQGPASLPLRESAHIVCDNALRVDWEKVCPSPDEGQEVFITGNPPFVGFNTRTKEHQADMKHVLEGRLKTYNRLDYVICWFVKLSDYIRSTSAEGALVSTSSVVQGVSVNILWPEVLKDSVHISFAHRPFLWANNAQYNAAVSCVIIGLSTKQRKKVRLFDENIETAAANINGYLLDGPDITVGGKAKPLFGLPKMDVGCLARDDGNLIFSEQERNALVEEYPRLEPYLKRYVGAKELVQGVIRYCLWVNDNQLEFVKDIPEIRKRLESVAKFRSKSDAEVTRLAATTPHRFGQITGNGVADKQLILVPRTSSERRVYLPADLKSADFVASADCQILFDAPSWCLSILVSKMHLSWLTAITGRLEGRIRYSSTLCWHAFPIPNFTGDQLEALNASARKILKTRYSHYPATIAQLYDPEKMPVDLRAVHRENDELLETMYIGRPFRNDTERLEHLFKLYAAKIKQIEKQAAKSKRGKRSK